EPERAAAAGLRRALVRQLVHADGGAADRPAGRGAARPVHLLTGEHGTMQKTLRASLTAAALAAAATALSAQGTRITGAGATFPYPIYTKWVLEYASVRPNIQINYAGIGSGGGIRQFTDHTVDFGATDGPMNDSQITVAGGNVLHIPTVLGSVVPVY